MSALQTINIYNALLALPDKNPDNIIAFYNKQLLILNNISSLETEDELLTFMAINDYYINALVYKKQFNNALTIIAKVLPLIDLSLEKLNIELRKEPSYLNIIFNKAVACNQLRDYAAAYQILKPLTELDPQNDLYKLWLRGSDHGRQKVWLNTANYTFGIMILLSLFNRYIPFPFVRIGLPLIGTIGLIACYIYERDLKRHFRTASV
jgi:tetratricopeptide (TPR) repeat protein